VEEADGNAGLTGSQLLKAAPSIDREVEGVEKNTDPHGSSSIHPRATVPVAETVDKKKERRRATADAKMLCFARDA
jgi:hypothetical protein